MLEVRDLAVRFANKRGGFFAVDGVNFSVGRGRTLGIVGESGSGKSITALALMRLLPTSAAIVRGDIQLGTENLGAKSEAEMRSIRGGRIAMIFQDPMTSLNPTMTIGDQIAESIRIHRKVSNREAMRHAQAMLTTVHIAAADKRLRNYPHELSGGMRQRVMIAMALACDPDVLIADEPTTALDVTIQAQILALIAEMRERLGMAVVLITHDLGVVAESCDDVLVMYAGKAVERAPTDAIFHDPRMPYTQGLLRSLPRMNDDPNIPLQPIMGVPPNAANLPSGCVFAPRCPDVMPRCTTPPPLFEHDGRYVRCWLAE